MKKITYIIVLLFILLPGLGLLQNTKNHNKFNEEIAVLHINELQQSVKNINNEIKKLDKLFEEKDEYYFTTRQEIQGLANNMQTTINQLENDINKLDSYKKEIQVVSKKIDQLNKQKEETKKKIESLINIVYQLHNELYNEGSIDEMKIFLRSEELSTVTSQELYVNTLISSLKKMLAKLKRQQTEHSQMLENLYEKKRSKEEKLTTYQKEIEKLEQKEIYLYDFIKLYKQNQTKLQQKIENILHNRLEIETEIKQIINEIQQNNYQPNGWDRREKKEQLYSMKQRGTQESFTIARPILPIENINYYFHDIDFAKKHSFKHNGIQISTQQSTPVHSPLDGIVVKAIDNYNIGVNRLLIAHKDGLTSSFLYINNIIVKEGDIIRQGQVVGYTGTEPGSRSTSIMSKGGNLTFMIAKGKEFLDPLKLLDISVISNNELIPETMKIKYHRDIQKMDIDMTTSTFMEGDTIKERRSTFLKTYASDIYRNTAIREKAGDYHYIDPITVSCIVFAETTLGNHFASNNNPGNVGNPDDPSIRTDFHSPLAGIQAIYDTLDNRFLYDRYTIDELSGFGELNQGLELYATSDFNRQNNVQRCLTSIYGFYVPKNFPFRTGPVNRITTSFEASPQVTYPE